MALSLMFLHSSSQYHPEVLCTYVGKKPGGTHDAVFCFMAMCYFHITIQ